MKCASLIIVILVLMLPVLEVMAGDVPTDAGVSSSMTLRDCLLYAREHAHSNRINRLETAAASADRRIGMADMMPYIALGSNGSLSFGRNIDPETNTYDNKKTLGTGLGLEMSLPLFDGLVHINNVKALNAARMRRQKAQEAEEDRVSLEVIRDFYNIIYCEAMVKQMERQLQRDSTDLEGARRALELGTKSGADVAQLEALVAADVYELTNQTNLLRKAHLSLRSAMGMAVSDTLLCLDADAEYLPALEITRQLPEIEEANLGVTEGRMNLRIAKGGYSPRLSFNAGVSTSYYRMMGMSVSAPSFARQFRDNMGEYFSFSLSLPVFDGLATAGRVRKASILLEESRTRLEQMQFSIRQASEEALLDHTGAVEELKAARSRLDAEKIAYRAIRRKYEIGAASAIDLYTSSSKLAQAEANLTGKRIQLIISEITLRYYEGHPLIY